MRNAVGTAGQQHDGRHREADLRHGAVRLPAGLRPTSPLNASNSVPPGPTARTWPRGRPRSPSTRTAPTRRSTRPWPSRRRIDQLDSIKSSEDTVIGDVASSAQSLRSKAQQEATLFFVGAVGAIALALIIAFYVARSVTVPLKKLTTAAYSLSTDKLPGLVERLRNPDESGTSLSEALAPIDINSKDEIGQLADAFNSIQHVTDRGGRGAGRPAPQGHRRHLHQPGPSQPDPPRPPDRVHRPARGQRGRPRPARQPVQARPPGHPHATQRRVAARAGRRRAAPPSWSPGRPGRRGPRGHRRGRGLRPHLAARPRRRHRGRQRGRRPRPPALRAHGERHPLLAARHHRRDRRAPLRRGLHALGQRPGHRHERRSARRGQHASWPARRSSAWP